MRALLGLISVLTLVGCATYERHPTQSAGHGTYAEMQKRKPAQASQLVLKNDDLGSIVCINNAHAPDQYFHYVLDLRQRKGGPNGPWTWVESGELVVVQDYSHGEFGNEYGNFVAKLELDEDSITLTGVPDGSSSDYHSYRELVSKPNFSLTWSVARGGTVKDAEKARRMAIKQSPVNCFQPSMQLEGVGG